MHLEALVSGLRRFIELHNHDKIPLLEPMKDKFNHSKRRVRRRVYIHIICISTENLILVV